MTELSYPFLAIERDDIPGRMPDILRRYESDRDCLARLLVAPASPTRVERMRRFLADWLAFLETMPFETLSQSDRADWHLFRAHLKERAQTLERDAATFSAVTERLLPFALDLISLDENRRAFVPVAPREAAQTLEDVRAGLTDLRAALENGTDQTRPVLAVKAARICGQLYSLLEEWFGFYHQYDPVFDWWVETPYRALAAALAEYTQFLRETLGGAVGDAVVGEPIGRDAIVSGLLDGQVPYSPEELIDAARGEMGWCLEELRRAAHEMDYGDDWRAALERVKSDHADPGAQPALVRDLAYEAITYVEENDLVTIPPLARECWRMGMMSAERQKVSPFFLGGEEIIVSFPTSEMPHPQKRMSLRGNNRAFARATVHHELIPGHHLQLYSLERYHAHRKLFWTPFWIEGWTLHWEMLLWERDFARTPAERIGMLFWRMHRAARVIFSLEYHMEQRTAAECIAMLVDDAGHERDNAVAEVRRSFEGDYGALYQCAYLIGGWQMHALYREMVGGGRMSDREFHDAVLRENCLPIPTLRALLTGETIEADFAPQWRFLPLPEPDGQYAVPPE